MRELTEREVKEVGGAGIYTAAHHEQYRSMVTNAVGGAIMGGAGGFAVGLVVGAITGYKAK